MDTVSVRLVLRGGVKSGDEAPGSETNANNSAAVSGGEESDMVTMHLTLEGTSIVDDPIQMNLKEDNFPKFLRTVEKRFK